MTAANIRKKFVAFFSDRQHQVVPSASLIPGNDPSVLLTTAGMQQFKPYLLGQADPLSAFGNRRLTSVQRCFRTSDIDSVGDATHLTFFEMLGNFSIGDYSKQGAIDLAWECLTKTFKLPKHKLWATVFSGDQAAGKDIQAIKLWQRHLPDQRISDFGRSDNWWGPPGTTGPCGPSSEIHYQRRDEACERGQHCRPNCACGRFVEIWNLVFMEYFQDEAGRCTELPTKNVDTGMGLERLAMVLQKVPTVFETDLFAPILDAAAAAGASPAEESDIERARRLRIVADHLKGAVFLLVDGVRFSNKDQGYVLRRVFRRALDQLPYPLAAYPPIVAAVVAVYAETYPFVQQQRQAINQEMQREAEGFVHLIETTMQRVTSGRHRDAVDQPMKRRLTADQVFQLRATHGISLERLRREGFEFDLAAVQKKIQEHRAISRAGAVAKFGGHGLGGYALDASKLSPEQAAQVTRLHTATHLLHQALRTVLGAHVRQQGSDINSERLRFDFSHPTMLSSEQIRQVEDLVNQQIQRDLRVSWKEVPLSEALESGALSFFRERYPDRVRVYSVGDFSKEICGGPHVEHTLEIGQFSITSEKSSAAGTRRIKAVVVA
ncbi:MAG: alanine--tRNA ligase [Candidatus Kerfeldbacteria bacterium]|nr:alanine--tRNA ligase [Candidatus Kerfeldbacteria bacterium]